MIKVPENRTRRVKLYESKSSPGVFYRVEEKKDGKIKCDCPTLNKYECWHIRAFKCEYNIK